MVRTAVYIYSVSSRKYVSKVTITERKHKYYRNGENFAHQADLIEVSAFVTVVVSL